MLRLLSLLFGILAFPALPHAAEFRTGKIRPDGTASYVIIRGKIEAGDSDKFRQAVLRLIRGGNYLGNVRIYSPGGDVAEALNIGRQLRLLKASTQAPDRLVDPKFHPGINQCYAGDEVSPELIRYGTMGSIAGQGDSSCVCMSACFLIWAAGTGRYGSLLGVHRPSFSDQAWYGQLPQDSAKIAYERVIDETQRYLQEMGIPESIVSIMLAVNSSNMHYLDSNQLLQLRNHEMHLEEQALARCGRGPPLEDARSRRRWSSCRGTVYTGAYNKAAIPAYLKQYGVP